MGLNSFKNGMGGSLSLTYMGSRGAEG